MFRIPLFPYPGTLRLRKEVAAWDVTIGSEEVVEQEVVIATLVRKAYLQLYLVNRSLVIVNKNRDLLRKFVIITQSKYEVVRQHFTKYGYRRTVIDEIVREVGIAKGTFYFHFKSKEELFFAVLDCIDSKFFQAFAEGIAKVTTAIGKFRFMMRYVFETMEREPLYAELVSEDFEYGLLVKIGERMHQDKEFIEHRRRFIRGIAQEGIKRGELRPDLDLEVLPFLLGSLKFLHYYIDLTTGDLISRERYIEGLIDLVCNGLARKGEDGKQKRPLKGRKHGVSISA